MQKTSKKTNRYVILSAIGTVLLLVLVTLYASGRLDRFLYSGMKQQDFKNITLTDAMLTCEERLRGLYGDKVRTLTMEAA